MSLTDCRQYEEAMALVAADPDVVLPEMLSAHLAVCEACHDEYDWICAASKDLEALGVESTASMMRNAPAIDVLDEVMSVVRNAQRNTRPIKITTQFRMASRFPIWRVARLAAAAALVLTTVWLLANPFNHPDSVSGPVANNPSSGSSSDPKASRKTSAADIHKQLAETRRNRTARSLAAEALKQAQAPGDMNRVADISVEQILDLFRDGSEVSQTKLARMATLTPDQARAIVRSAQTSLEAKIGASKVLPPAEAQAVLQEALKTLPNDPSVHYELANALAAQPGKEAAASEEYRKAAKLDPNNALIQYRLASTLMAQGETQGALNALQQGRNLLLAGDYTQTNEANRVQALAASGMSSDAARTLTAATAGSSEYSDITSFGTQLLAYGQEYEAQGNYAAAQQLYEAVNALGGQLFSSSNYTMEQLAGLDIQQQAISLLTDVFDVLGMNDYLTVLGTQAQALQEAITQVSTAMDTVRNLFSSSLSASALNNLINSILGNGDANLQ